MPFEGSDFRKESLLEFSVQLFVTTTVQDLLVYFYFR
jgi:hypothetical protein